MTFKGEATAEQADKRGFSTGAIAATVIPSGGAGGGFPRREVLGPQDLVEGVEPPVVQLLEVDLRIAGRDRTTRNRGSEL